MRHTKTSGHRTRKAEHLEICRSEPVEQQADSGFDAYRFVHEALPEMDLDQVDTSAELLGHKLAVPFIVSPMTGGIPEAGTINRIMAEAAQELGLAMGVGSQRIALLDSAVADTFHVRDVAPDILLFANIGAIQLNNGFTLDDCRRAMEMIGADALSLHLNPLQECLQTGGDTNFGGLLSKIENVCTHLGAPVMVKEVGHGISEQTARMLADAGVAVIDTAGAGGTSWALVESRREKDQRSEIGLTFSDWGISTAGSIVVARQGAPDVTLVASGGVRSGIDAAKAIALGADFAGFGLPVLRETLQGPEAVVRLLRRYTEELRIAMFCTATRTIADLKRSRSLMRI